MLNRLLAALLGCLICTVSATAGDEAKRLDADQTKKIVSPLLDATAKLALPIKMALDGERGTGLKAGKALVFVIPDDKLTVDVLKKRDKEVVPLGVLYLYKVTPVVVERGVAAEQHRTAEITVGTEKATVNVLTLAAARVAGRPVLLVYTNDKKPALVTEMLEVDDKSDWPLDLDARQVGNNRAALVVNVLGRFRAAIQVAGQDNE